MFKTLVRASSSLFQKPTRALFLYKSIKPEPNSDWVLFHRFCRQSYSETTRIMANGKDSADAALFRSIGLKETAIKNLLKNNQSSVDALKECIAEAKVTNGCDAAIGKQIFSISTSKKLLSANGRTNRPKLLEYVVAGKLSNPVQLAAAYNYCSTSPSFDTAEFEKSCGVGVVVTEQEIIQCVEEVVTKYKPKMKEKGKGLLGPMFQEMKQRLPWADGKIMSKLFNQRFNAALAESGFDPKSAKKKKKKCKDSNKSEQKEAAEEEEEVETMDKWLRGRALDVAKNSESQLNQKSEGLTKIGLNSNTFLARFPPEPNGFLHIGHCKAMTFNFTLADNQKGHCYLRFDDTNPTTEKQLYIDNIIENVEWMGFAPWKVTYSSQYFQELYDLAIRMIKNGDAYVCHQTGPQMEAERKTFRAKKPVPSPYRNRSVEENLKLFELMRVGYYAEGEAVLRMKGDYNSPNPNMWDHVAYRIMYAQHPKSGDAWCIYPTYDYTHCIVDSLEWITASCCTLEFENRRESYFWLLDVLDIYKPVVWEYSRLNITYNVLSKRKLLVMVRDGYVRGWDDPRMLTINGLRRRGFTATILRDFCNRVGVTRKDNFISPLLLEACAREELNNTCSRAMAVIKPLKIVLTNYKGDGEDLECPDFPQNKGGPTHKVRFNKIVYIDEDDFRSGQIKNKAFYGLTEGKTVRLKYAYNIKCVKVVYGEEDDDSKVIDHLECEYDPDQSKKVKKGHLTWVSGDGVPAEFRLYDHLFSVEKPGGDDWLKQLNAESEKLYMGMVDKYVLNTWKEKGRYQFERCGYFVADKDSETYGHPVFNRTVTLNETAKRVGKTKKSPNKKKGGK